MSECNQREVLPTHFREEEGGGFRLQPGSFGRTLHSWETYWTAAGLEAELDRWLDRLGELIRRCDDTAPGEEHSPDDL